MSNKFIKNLITGDSGIKEKRAGIVAQQAENAQTKLLTRLKTEKSNLELKIDQLQDLSPTDSTSLKVGGDNFDPEVWVLEIHNAKVELATKEIELEIAQKSYDEWFGPETPVAQ